MLNRIPRRMAILGSATVLTALCGGAAFAASGSGEPGEIVEVPREACTWVDGKAAKDQPKGDLLCSPGKPIDELGRGEILVIPNKEACTWVDGKAAKDQPKGDLLCSPGKPIDERETVKLPRDADVRHVPAKQGEK